MYIIFFSDMFVKKIHIYTTMKKLSILVFFLVSLYSFGQTGTIKGQILDKQSELPLPGATIELLHTELSKGVISDIDGYFSLENVPLGRHSIRVSYIGYETYTLPNIDLTSGKDVILQITLIEAFGQLEEVVITNDTHKDRAINPQATVSARQFSIEEVNRYAGGRNDVARLASNFAGVGTPDDSRNDIIVRGNSPTGTLWRLEGIPIPSPNHYNTLGTTGSPVSALNPNLLKNSDFMTSAFPAEYGNALGGVFDLGFRNGNKDDYEYTLQFGMFSGFEAMAEGPLGNNNGSFVAAGRYSSISIVRAGTSATPNYYDISFNANLGNTKLGKFSTFGIFGNSNIEFLGKDAKSDDLFAEKDANSYVKSGMGVWGIKHQLNIGERSYLKTIVGTAFTFNEYKEDRILNLGQANQSELRYTDVKNAETRWIGSLLFNSKINKKLTLRTGLVVENFSIDYKAKDREKQPDANNDGQPDLNTIISIEGSYNLFQPYIQGQFRLSEKLKLNAGLHGMYSSLNEQFIVEPRAALKWKLNKNNSFNFGYGIHHQNIPAPLLFVNEEVNGNLIRNNEKLDFVKNDHYVIGYDLKINRNWRGKMEVYYQNISKAGVEKTASSYSSLTEGADFSFSSDKTSLENTGTGYNQGIEFTLEKFFSKGFHALATTSLFESKYKGSDSIERNTPFNNGYIVNLLAGKEFKVGKEKKNVFSIDGRFATSGGRYYSPVDLAASRAAGFEITDDNNAFSKQYEAYLRLDIKFGMKWNSLKKKRSQELFVDLQNVTNRKNIFALQYNRVTNNVDRQDQIGFFPNIGYRFQF